MTFSVQEFAGTLLGFDDYVSEYTLKFPTPLYWPLLNNIPDMVLEDVTELFAAISVHWRNSKSR